MTGDPVRILRYFAKSLSFKICLVLLAVGFLIVVDSSIPISDRPIVVFKNLSAKSTPLFVEKASTFIINIFNLPSFCDNASSSANLV